MKCRVSIRFNREIDLKKVSIHVGNFAVTAAGQKYFFDFKKTNFRYVYDVVYEDDTVFVLYEGEELDLEKYPESLSLVRHLDKVTKLEACDISADDTTIYPVAVFGFVIESPYFYSENSTDYIECRSNDPNSPKKGFKIELLSDALMGYNNMLTIKNLINKADAVYQEAKEKNYAVDGDTILAKQITSINNDGYFSSYIFKSIVETWQEADTLQEKKQVEGMFRLFCGISLSEYLKNCIYETGEDTSYYREKESSVFIDPSVTDEMKNKLQHLEDIANETSDEVWDDDKEDGTSGILKLCDQLADKIHNYLTSNSENCAETQTTDTDLSKQSSKNTRVHYLYRDASNYKKPNSVVVTGLFSEEQIQMIISCLNEGQWFVPHKVGFPEEKFEEETEDDHPWFELYACDFEETSESPQLEKTPDEIVQLFLQAKDNWLDLSQMI